MVQPYCCLPLQYNHNEKPSQPALKEIGVTHDYLLPLAKVKHGEGHLGNLAAQKIQSKATVKGRSGHLLMVLAQTEQRDISRTVVTTPPLCPMRGLPTGMSQPPPASSPWRGPLFLHSVILWVLWPGPAFCLATSHLEESKAAEMCTTDGRNYVAHLTSEIFFSFFFSLSLFHKLLQDWGNW